MRTLRFLLPTVCLLPVLAATGCDDTTSDGEGGKGSAFAQTLFVAHGGVIVSYDIATGEARPGAIQNVAGPTDMQALADGTLLVNLSDKNEILAFDGRTMLEKARIPSSTLGGTRPVHSYLTPERAGKQYWIAMNDGAEGMKVTNSARFVDVTASSPTYLQAVGEIPLGVGHHKAAFSNTLSRVVITNIGDCDDVLSVFDYSDPAKIQKLATLTALQAGYDGSSFPKTCDPTYQMGLPPAPHGCGTATGSGRAYCNLTSSGDIVSIDIDASTPTFKLSPTGGAGGGYTKPHPAGRYIYSLQGEPRESAMGGDGAKCQIGQLVVIDSQTDTVASKIPLLYEGPACTRSLLGTDEETTEPSHILINEEGTMLFIVASGGYGVAEARVRQEMVVDIHDPAAPKQLASIPVGTSTSYHGDALSGDGKLLFIGNNQDGTVTQIDAVTQTVQRTLKVEANPQTLATFGDKEGPGHQTGPFH